MDQTKIPTAAAAKAFFIDTEAIDGGVEQKRQVAKTDNAEVRREQFTKICNQDIDWLENPGEAPTNKYGQVKGKFAEGQPDGRVKVKFVFRGQALKLAGKTYFFLRDAQHACEFLAKAYAAAQLGQLDEVLDVKVSAPAVDKYLNALSATGA